MVADSLYERQLSWLREEFGAEPLFKSQEDYERFRVIFGLELKISMNTIPTGDRGLGAGMPGRLTYQIVSDLELINKLYPDYVLPESPRRELEPFYDVAS